ncbi:MAG: hypothetical protein CL910_09780 [Deltaproteobacteria bacterium]|jgi:hypothetical protein|nr:hypothetical protein [Deltaproteobacteria bacterium]
MGKAFGIVMVAGLVWIGVEVYVEGTQGAFGGVFAELGIVDGEATHDAGSPAQRAGAAVERAHEERADRYDRVYDQAN